MEQPLVSVTIPTFFSGQTLYICLEAVYAQKYRPIEVIIIDSGSTDATRTIAKQYSSVRLYSYFGGLLGSRVMGILKAKGQYVVLLDSDQILRPFAIHQAVSLSETKQYSMIAFGEDVYERKRLLQKLYQCDRDVIEAVQDFNPYTGVILPRFFKRSLLVKATARIPKSIISTVGGPDHAILYYESYKISQRITSIPHSVAHMEQESIIGLIRKCYRWGYTSYSAKTIPQYRVLMRRKERFRKGLFTHGLWLQSFGSLVLLLLKGIPYKLGYLNAKIHNL